MPKFEELNMDLFHKTMKPILKDANVKKEDINEVSASDVFPAFPSPPFLLGHSYYWQWFHTY